MTTTRTCGTSEAWWRGGFGHVAAKRVGIVAGLGTLPFALRTASLLLYNLYGPLGERPTAAMLAALACAVSAAFAMFLLARRLAPRSRPGLVAVLGVSVLAGTILLPRQVDVSESWVPQPNERYACSGWSFEHYPPETYDADATTYCIGLEHRIADG
jgi:hypothetical protein